MKTIRVLLVDDSLEFLESAASFLSRHERVEVVGRAQSGADGVRLAQDLAPDLVLIDLVMPGMNGLLATRYIKMQPHVPRVVIVSLHDNDEKPLRAVDAGADGFVSKDRFADTILTLIDTLFPTPGSNPVKP